MRTATVALLVATLLASAMITAAQELHTVYLPLVVIERPDIYPTALGTPVVAERTPTPQGEQP